jgi:hypothetical protein
MNSWGVEHMVGKNKLVGLMLSLLVLLAGAAPAFAGGHDRDMDPQRDLRGVPHVRAHRWFFATAGGAAIGAGVGTLLPGGMKSTWKGLLIGGGGASSMYLLSHRDTGTGWRDWAFIGSNTALGTGIGWTLCNCGDGAVAGALIGGGGTGFWEAFGGRRGITSAANRSKDTIRDNTH